jgi:hypothetical protein
MPWYKEKIDVHIVTKPDKVIDARQGGLPHVVTGAVNTVFELMNNTVFASRGVKLAPETLK